MNILSYMENAIKKIINTVNIVSGILMIILTLVVFTEVVVRYFFNYPLAITSELTMLIFPWISFLVAITVTYDEEHIGLTFFKNSLSGKKKLYNELFSNVTMFLFSIYMTFSSMQLTYAVRLQKMPILKISRSWFYLSIVVSFVIITFIVVYKIILLINSIKNYEGVETFSLDKKGDVV